MRFPPVIVTTFLALAITLPTTAQPYPDGRPAPALRMDAKVLDYLDRSGLAKNTIVIYTSDQGFFLGDHGLYDKRFMYEESLRMPLIIRHPGHIEPDTRAADMVLNIDIAPTLLDFAGLPVPDDMQGESFQPITRGRTPADWRDAMYYRFVEQAFGVGPHEGIRTRRYKLIHFLYGDEGWELFDLKSDPGELTNLYHSPDHQQRVAELKQRLAELKKHYRAPEEAGPSAPAR